MTRSAYLAQLADDDLAGRIGPGADPRVRTALHRIEELLTR